MATDDVIYSREQVSDRLAVSHTVLLRYEARGLIHAVRRGETEGYAASEIRRIWTVVSLQRDLGINLAGVEAIVKLRDRMLDMQSHLSELAEKLQYALESEASHAGNK